MTVEELRQAQQDGFAIQLDTHTYLAAFFAAHGKQSSAFR